MTPILTKGLVQIYTGPGKGKTTAALGLVWRMLGWGGRVYICQFLKPANLETGERQLAEKMGADLIWDSMDMEWDMYHSFDNPEQVGRMSQVINDKLRQILRLAKGGSFDLIVLDELIFAVSKKMADRKLVESIIQEKAATVELVLTGRGADEDLMARADMVSVIDSKKHPWEQGIEGRRGIEY